MSTRTTKTLPPFTVTDEPFWAWLITFANDEFVVDLFDLFNKIKEDMGIPSHARGMITSTKGSTSILVTFEPKNTQFPVVTMKYQLSGNILLKQAKEQEERELLELEKLRRMLAEKKAREAALEKIAGAERARIARHAEKARLLKELSEPISTAPPPLPKAPEPKAKSESSDDGWTTVVKGKSAAPPGALKTIHYGGTSSFNVLEVEAPAAGAGVENPTVLTVPKLSASWGDEVTKTTPM
jgi:hypothetical protein